MSQVAAMLTAGALLFALDAAAQTDGSRPNVVLIVTDDVGYGDIGSYGVTDIKTPHIDRLAREGVRLTDFYAAPQCTPTRAALMTGRYQQRVRLENALSHEGAALDQGLATTGWSLPQLMKNQGYATGLVGKWHLGFKPEFGPNAHGFDYFFGFLSGYIDFYTHVRGGDGASDLFENTTAVTETGYMTDLITTRAVRFIQQTASRPFFLEIAYNATHYPFQPPDRPPVRPTLPRLQTALDDPPPTRRDYAAMLERVDEGVGQVLATLDRLGLARNTLVIFTSDNGGEWLSRNAPLFHRKRTLWEGGIRVPAILRWPDRLPANVSSAQVGITMDLTASILAAANAPVPVEAKPEGLNLLPVLQGQSKEVERTLFWRFNTAARQQRAVRSGEWKLLVDSDHLMLFNLRRDIGEREDLAQERPDLVAKLSNLLSQWETDVNAEAQALSKSR